MGKKIVESRRNFLKASAISAAGFAFVGTAAKKAAAAPISTTLVNLSTTPVNMDVDNLRVAYITDAPAGTVTSTSMVRSTSYPGFDNFNSPTNTTTGVNYAAVQSNLDKLACALAAKTDATQAWATLLKIPASKTWATAKIAIKPNSRFNAHPCVPILAKICRVLLGFGALPGNITIYDGDGNPGLYNTTNYVGTDATLIPSGIIYSTGYANNLTWPASAGGETFGAVSCLVGADILINISANKGHDQWVEYSGVTMCQKNHKGTIVFHCDDNVANPGVLGTQRLVNSNSCVYVAGNIPAAYPALQQLCIIDSLWLGNNGDYNGGIADKNNANSIVMGTFAGATDYVGTMKIRKYKFNAGTDANSGWNQPIVDRFVTGYGYPTSAITTVMTPVAANMAGPGIVDASGIITSTLPEENRDLTRQNSVQISVSGNGARPFNTSLSLSNGETVQSAEIFSVQGRKVRTVALNSGSNRILWDGRTDSGSLAKTGNYVVRIRGQKSVISGDVVLSR
jgi:hypothetical protein